MERPRHLYDQREPKALPLLSRMLADLSPLFGGDIDKTGLVLSPLLSSLFMIPLFLCCWRLGVPAAGLMGGLVATFCIEYYQRTSVGWVDTDSLNLFFPWTVSCLILAMHGGQRRRDIAAAVGRCRNRAVRVLPVVWQTGPDVALRRRAGGPPAACESVVASNGSLRRHVGRFRQCPQFGSALVNLEDFGHRYLWPSAAPMQNASSAIRFPDVWSTIGEARRLQLAEVLRRILGRADLAVIGLVAFAAFAIVRWRSMAALAPDAAAGNACAGVVAALHLLPRAIRGHRLGTHRFAHHRAPAEPDRNRCG